MKNQNYWKNGVNEIIKKILNGNRTITEAKKYLESYYIGDTRKAHEHQCYESTSKDQFAELTVYHLLRDAIKLGYGKDNNLETVFR